MFKKSTAFFLAVVAMAAAVFMMYWKYIRQPSYPVFIESFDHGVMTVDKTEGTGDDNKFKVVCKRGDTLTVNINPERTDKTYYNLSKLVVNGEDVTDQVSMLQYKVQVNHKLTILAYFKKGTRPSAETTDTSVDFPDPPTISEPFDIQYLGSRDAYNIKDPSVIYDSDSGYYYCFGSDNVVVRSKDLVNWDDRTNYFKVPESAQSASIMDFSVFPSVNSWAKTHGYDNEIAFSTENNDRTPLAPCIIKRGSTYYLYYSLCKSKDANEAAIFCVRTDDLQYSVENNMWTDVGLVLSTCGYNEGENKEDEKNSYYDASSAVHPSVVAVGSKLYMAYGSYYGEESLNGGIYLVELDPKTGLLKESSSISKQGEEISTVHGSDRYNTGVLIARPGSVPALGRKEGSLVTAVDLVYNSDNKYYYLFMTYGVEQTNYNIRVARSKSVDGPYLDFNSQSMSEFANSRKANQYTKGFKLIGGYNFEKSSAGGASYTDIGKASTGSPCIIQTQNGKWIMASQSRVYYKADGEIVTGDEAAKENELSVNTYPALEIRQILFSGSNWPFAVPEPYAGEQVGKTVKASNMYGNWDVIVFDNSASSEDYTAIERSTSQTVSILDGAVISETDIKKNKELHKNALSKINSKAYSLLLDDVTYTIYPVVAWDWELQEGTLTFTGVGEDGSTIWGKKNFSSDAGIYSDTFYYLLAMTDSGTQEKYKEKIAEISDNPSQSEIDTMTGEIIDLLLGE